MSAIEPFPELLPSYISVEVTSRCNLTCTMCSLTQGLSSTSGKATYITPELWQRFTNDVRGWVDQVQVTGFGEPTLHPRFGAMLAELDTAGVATGFTTNGTRITDAFLAQIGSMSRLLHVNVSIDTPDPTIYREIRGGKLAKVRDNIRKLASAGGSHEMTISAVAMRSTIASLEQLPALARDLGVEKIVVQSLYDQTEDGIGEDVHLANAASASLAALEDRSGREGIQLTFEHPARLADDLNGTAVHGFGSGVGMTTKNCGLPWYSFHMDAAGTVFPCCRASAENASPLGNAKEQTLAEIWNGPRYAEFREGLANPERCPDVCTKCTVAPAGLPGAVLYAATLIPDLSRETDDGFIVVFRNTGREVWRDLQRPLLGTAGHKDHHSEAYHSSWLSPNRAALPKEPEIAVGEYATYEVIMNPVNAAKREHFQLVLDGSHWLPGTRFSAATRDRAAVLPMQRARANWLRRFSRHLQRLTQRTLQQPSTT